MLGVSPQSQALCSSLGRYRGYMNEQLLKPLQTIYKWTFVFNWLLFPSFQEMEKQNFNGPDFQYKVMWRRVVGSGPDWHTDYRTAPTVIVSDVGNFSAFEIKVQAVNEKGEGPEPDPVIGYSGEDGKIKKNIWLLKSLQLFFCWDYFYCVFFVTYHFLSATVLSSIGGSNGCGCFTS